MANERRKVLFIRVAQFAHGLQGGAITAAFPGNIGRAGILISQQVGDVVGQTHETLNNIAALISEDNLSRHGLPGLGTSLDGLGLARVYIKRHADYAATRAACEQRLGELPTIYAVGDVCRPELLVEIEGIAFSRKAPTPLPDIRPEDLDRLRWKATVA